MPLKTGFVVQGSHIIIISEGWCDTEDCINGWWKCSFACQHRNKLHFKIYLNKKTVILSKSNISQKHSFKNIFNKYLVKYVCIYLFITPRGPDSSQTVVCLFLSLLQFSHLSFLLRPTAASAFLIGRALDVTCCDHINLLVLRRHKLLKHYNRH